MEPLARCRSTKNSLFPNTLLLRKANSTDASGGARPVFSGISQAGESRDSEATQKRVPCGFALGTENSETYLKTLTLKGTFSSPGGERLPWMEEMTVLR